MSIDWYRNAKVRGDGAGPHLARTGLPFSPELAPHVGHPWIPEELREPLLRGALRRYLAGTATLEVDVVNEVARDLAAGRAPLDVSAAVRRDAMALYCDEGYHALLCEDLLAQLGAPVDERPAPAFLTRLGALVDASCTPARTRFLFTVVTETAISRSLAQLGRDRRLDGGVRRFVAEHAADEARHNAFFTALFATYFTELTPVERRAVQEELPGLVLAYLTPDTGAVTDELLRYGLTRGEAETVVGESFTDAWIRRAVIDGARPTLVCFERAGALAAGRARDAFAAAGWEA